MTIAREAVLVRVDVWIGPTDTFANWGADARSWWDDCDPDILRLPAWLGGPGLTKPKGRD